MPRSTWQISAVVHVDDEDIGVTYMGTVCNSWAHDPAYGEDADGKRGIPTDFLEDQVIEECSVRGIANGSQKEMTVASLPEWVVKAMLEKAEVAK